MPFMNWPGAFLPLPGCLLVVWFARDAPQNMIVIPRGAHLVCYTLTHPFLRCLMLRYFFADLFFHVFPCCLVPC